MLCETRLRNDEFDYILQVFCLQSFSDLCAFIDSYLEVGKDDVNQVANLLLDET